MIVVIALTASMYRHLRLDRLQLRLLVLLWLPGRRWLRLRLPDRLLSPQARKVRTGGKGELLVGRQSIRQVSAIGNDNAVFGDKAGKTVAGSENRAGDLLASPGGANIVVEGLLAAVFQIRECRSDGFSAIRIQSVLHHMLH